MIFRYLKYCNNIFNISYWEGTIRPLLIGKKMSSPSLIFGPIPPFNNPTIEPQFFKPSVFNIIAIKLGQTTIVTTSVDNNYVIGQLCRLIIPNGYGSRGLNEQVGYVINIPAPNQVELNIFSLGVDPFNLVSVPTQPQIVSIGDVNSGIISNTGRILPTTTIPGSFINIS